MKRFGRSAKRSGRLCTLEIRERCSLIEPCCQAAALNLALSRATRSLASDGMAGQRELRSEPGEDEQSFTALLPGYGYASTSASFMHASSNQSFLLHSFFCSFCLCHAAVMVVRCSSWLVDESEGCRVLDWCRQRNPSAMGRHSTSPKANDANANEEKHR